MSPTSFRRRPWYRRAIGLFEKLSELIDFRQRHAAIVQPNVQLNLVSLDVRICPAVGPVGPSRLMGSFTVPSDGTTVNVTDGLPAGNYTLLINGDIQTDSFGTRGDAEYLDFSEDHFTDDPGYEGIRIEGDDPDEPNWDEYCPDHTYTLEITFDGTNDVEVYFYDPIEYNDNVGFFNLEVYDQYLEPQEEAPSDYHSPSGEDEMGPDDECDCDCDCDDEEAGPTDEDEPETEDEYEPEYEPEYPPDESGDTSVDYSDGSIRVSEEELVSEGFGFDWSHEITWTNDPGIENCDIANGAGIIDNEMPWLEQIDVNGDDSIGDGDEIVLISNHGNPRYFDIVDGTFVSRDDRQDKLSLVVFNQAEPGPHDDDEIILVDARGAKLHFYAFTHSEPHLWGKLKLFEDPNGHDVTIDRDDMADYRITQISRTDGTHTESFVYYYIDTMSRTPGRLIERVEWIKDEVLVRAVDYDYHLGSTDFGSAATIKTVTLEDGVGNPLTTTYYRWWMTGQEGGYNNALKFVIHGAAYERMLAALDISDGDDATDSELAAFADRYFEFDDLHRVSRADIRGLGTDGIGKYTYAYEWAEHDAPPGYNHWLTKTTETLPDGNQNIVYTNANGQVMAFVFQEQLTGRRWIQHYVYDGQGRLIQSSAPSAAFNLNDDDPTLMITNGARLGIETEFQVNTYTASSQARTAIASDWVGNYVVTWMSNGQDGDGYGIYAQRYNAVSQPQDGEFKVNFTTSGDQSYPSIAMDSIGNFVIVWTGVDASGTSIYGQLYDRYGHEVDDEFQVNANTTGAQTSPSVAMDADGNFVVVWTDADASGTGIFGRRFESDGAPLDSNDVQINSTTSNNQKTPSVAMDHDGDYIVVWESYWEIFGRLFDPSGTAQDLDFKISQTTTKQVYDPAVAMDADGDFVAAWTQLTLSSPSIYDVYARRYNAAGSAQSNEFRVNSYTTGRQYLQSIAMNAGGDFLIAWSTHLEGGNPQGVYATFYMSDGMLSGGPFKINDYTTTFSAHQALASDYDGNFVTAWQNNGHDGDSWGIYARPLERTYSYVSDTGGLIVRYHYGRVTTADSSSAGDVAGNLKSVWLSRGELDTAPIKQNSATYYTRTVDGHSVFPIATTTDYRTGDESSAITTTRTYEWTTGYFRPSQITVMLPAIASGQNGSGTANSTVTVLDEYGRSIWFKDEAEFIHYTRYDLMSSAVVRTIVDVDTDVTSDFENLPSGWKNVNGKHLKTETGIDLLGRSTKITDPNGYITFMIHNDKNHEVRTYPGWTGTTTTGPTLVTITNHENRYTDTFTMTATPDVSGGGEPLGTEAYSDLQSLTRTSVNDAGQVIDVDAYFDLDGLDYNDQTEQMSGNHSWILTDAVQNTNFYRSTSAYDNRGRLTRAVSPTGTIERVLYDALGRVTSSWVGTADSTSWSPAAPGTSNLTQITSNVYDNGGIGDSNLTGSMAYPGSSTPRLTLSAYDWRNRQVIVKDGALAAASGNPSVQLGASTNDVTEPTSTGNTSYAYVWVTLTAVSNHPISVKYATTAGTATAGSDYTTTSGTLIIPAGQIGRTIAVPILGDSASESAETLTLTLSNPSGAKLGSTTSTTITIRDQDNPESATLRFAAGALTVKESGGFAEMTLTQPAEGAEFSYHLTGGSASAGTDYSTITLNHVFAAGETSFSFPLPILNDASNESTETVTLVIDNVSGVSLPGSASSISLTVTIIDDDFASTSESTSDNFHPISYVEYDNLGQVVASEMYDGDTITLTNYSNGVPNRPDSKYLRAKQTTSFDDLGRVYRTDTYGVTYTSTSATPSIDTLYSKAWYNSRGQLIKSLQPGGLVTKFVFDSAGRTTNTYVTNGGGDTGYGDADDVTGDTVYEESHVDYDANSNAIAVTAKQRTHYASGTGALGDATNEPYARVSYSATWFDDDANRVIATADYGTNGGNSWERPSDPPDPSDTELVVTYEYDPAGRLFAVTDPRDIVSQTYYDNLDRTIKTIQNYVDGTVSAQDDKTTEFVYDGASHLVSYKAWLDDTNSEETQYQYGVLPAYGSAIASNDLLSVVYYPDPDTGGPTPAQFTYSYSALGETTTLTDINNTTHEYTIDVLGRLTADTVTNFGDGVDQTVEQLATVFDSAGRAYLFTSYDHDTHVVNQVMREFNGLGQVTAEYQQFDGEVNSTYVGYSYTSISENRSLLASMTYPNGKTLTFSYDGVSRLTSTTHDDLPSEQYDYLGLGTVVERRRAEIMRQTFYRDSETGEAGDNYVGLDRFGRFIDLLWQRDSDSAELVHHKSYTQDESNFAVGYDRDSNRLWRTDELNHDYDELYHTSAAIEDANRYDGLNQLTAFSRGELTDSNSDGFLDEVSSPDREQSWAFDGLGNFTSVSTDGTPESRSHDFQNRLIEKGSDSMTYDAAGNMTTDETGRTFSYDAWNRPVAVNETARYSYDALNRRITEGDHVFYYSTSWQVIEERIDTTNAYQYVWSPVYIDALSARLLYSGEALDQLDQTIYALQDVNWNIVALTDDTGDVLARITYDPYGRFELYDQTSGFEEANEVNPWLYFHQGGRWDATSELFHFRNRDYSPTLMRWVEQDKAGFADGSNFYRYVSDSPIDNLDPLGLWKIERKGSSLAKATAEEGDTIESLAKAIGLDASQSGAWLTVGANGVKLSNGTQAKGNIDPKAKICPNESVSVPNQIIYAWIGALEGFGQAATGWDNDIRYLKDRGFQIANVEYVPGKPNPAGYKNSLLNSLKTGTEKKELHGLVVAGHGAQTMVQSDDRLVNISYQEMGTILRYKLAFIILNVCAGDWSNSDKGFSGPAGSLGGRDLSSQSPGSIFKGVKDTLVPPFQTMHPKDCLKPGAQGSK